MPSLNDLLLLETKASREAVDLHVSQLQELGSQLKVARERQRVLQTEAGAAQQAEQESRKQLDDLGEEIEALRAKLGEMEVRRQTLQEQQPVLLARAAEAQRALRQNLKDRESLEHQEPELASNKLAAEAQLHAARRRAFAGFLSETAKQFVDFRLESRRSEASRLRKAEFERVRHEDHDLMAAWEQYEEYGKLVAMVGVPAVKAELEKRRAEAKALIEHRYPGVLSSGTGSGAPSDVMQLYWMPDDDPHKTRFFLPITPDVWRQLNEGTVDEAGETALWIVWGVCSRLVAEEIAYDLRHEGEWVVLVADGDPECAVAIEAIQIPLKSGDKANLEVQTLPDIVKEAILKTDDTA